MSLNHSPLALLIHLLSVKAYDKAKFCQFFLGKQLILGYSHFKSAIIIAQGFIIVGISFISLILFQGRI